jgi:hypothetical protein
MATCVAPGGHPMHHGFVQHLIVTDDERPHPAIENPIFSSPVPMLVYQRVSKSRV